MSIKDIVHKAGFDTALASYVQNGKKSRIALIIKIKINKGKILKLAGITSIPESSHLLIETESAPSNLFTLNLTQYFFVQLLIRLSKLINLILKNSSYNRYE